jgi:hypothetical protein
VVTLVTGGGAVPAGQGHVTLRDNQKADIAARFKPEAPQASYTLVIRLGNPVIDIELHGRTT